MIRERLCRVLLLGGIIGFVVSFNITNEVSAATKLSRVFMDKAALQGAYICYTGGRVKTSINPISEYKDMGSLINKKDTDTNYVPLASKPWNPSGSDDIRYIIKDDGLGYKQLFKGGIYGFVGVKGTNQGLLEAMGKSAPSDKAKVLAAF